MKKIFVKVEEIRVIKNIKKTPAQKIRDYFKNPKWRLVKDRNLNGEYKFK